MLWPVSLSGAEGQMELFIDMLTLFVNLLALLMHIMFLTDAIYKYADTIYKHADPMHLFMALFNHFLTTICKTVHQNFLWEHSNIPWNLAHPHTIFSHIAVHHCSHNAHSSI